MTTEPDYHFSSLFEATVYFDVPDPNDDIQDVFDEVTFFEQKGMGNAEEQIEIECGDISPCSYPWVTIRGGNAEAVHAAAKAVVARVLELKGRLNP